MVDQITWTELPDKSGATLTAHTGTWPDLVQRLRTVGTFPDKDHCPWVKLATFGTVRSEKGSLRTNENTTAVFGVEGDYDGELVSMDDARAMLEKHGIKAVVYPSPSNETVNPPHSHGGPRWRVLAPLAKPHPPGERYALLARINGALGGILFDESFKVSQGFYFGATPTNNYRVLTTFNDPAAGHCVDTLTDLDRIAIGKRSGTDKAAGPVTLNIFDDAVAKAGGLLGTGDNRRELLKTYLASMSAKHRPADELRLLVRGVAAEFFDPNHPVDWENIDAMVDDFARKDAPVEFDDLIEQAKAQPEPRYKLLKSADIAQLPSIEWCVHGVLPTTGLAAGYGPSGSGKSFLFFDMAAAIAAGAPWFNCRVVARPVCYLVLEGEGGIKQRVQAWERHNGRPLPGSMSVVTQPFTLTEKQDLADLAAVVPAGAVVVVDTLNRAAPTTDENSSRDMGEILQACKMLQAETGGVVLLVHHTGKDATKGLRGHSSLFAAMDAAVEVSRDGDRREWRCAKSKDSHDGVCRSFTLESMPVGVDRYGDAETSCIVVPTFDPVVTRKPLSPALQLAMAAFHAADLFGDGVTRDDWRDELYRLLPDVELATKRKALSRAAVDLVQLGYLERDGELFSEPLF